MKEYDYIELVGLEDIDVAPLPYPPEFERKRDNYDVVIGCDSIAIGSCVTNMGCAEAFRDLGALLNV